MSQRREKRRRRIARGLFQYWREIWLEHKPPWWRFLRRRRWKRCEPKWEEVRKWAKKL